MNLTAELEGADELLLEAARAEEELRDELRTASIEAAEAGIEEAQADHPYEDRTQNLTGSARAVAVRNIAEMRWPADYASYVNDGTSRSRAFPFTPKAEARAQASLDRKTEQAVKRFEDKVQR